MLNRILSESKTYVDGIVPAATPAIRDEILTQGAHLLAINEHARKLGREDGENSSSPLHARDGQVGGDHYRKHGHMQVWDIAEEYYGKEALAAFLKINGLKYLLRGKEPKTDIKKALHCLTRLVELDE